MMEHRDGGKQMNDELSNDLTRQSRSRYSRGCDRGCALDSDPRKNVGRRAQDESAKKRSHSVMTVVIMQLLIST